MDSKQIRELRLRLGWSQAELARHLGVGLSRVQALESGASMNPTELSICLKWQEDLAPLSENVRNAPVLESFLKQNGLSQIDQSSVDLDKVRDLGI